jgi:hypothetical protein
MRLPHLLFASLGGTRCPPEAGSGSFQDRIAKQELHDKRKVSARPRIRA